MAAPIAAFSPGHEAFDSFPTVTTFSVTSTWATPGSANNRSMRGDPAARSLLSKKKGPPGWTIRLTVNLQMSGSANEVSAWILMAGSTGSTSDIFGDLGCAAVTKSPQVLERVNPGAVAVVPVDRDGVIARARDGAGGHVGPYALGIQQRASAHLL